MRRIRTSFNHKVARRISFDSNELQINRSQLFSFYFLVMATTIIVTHKEEKIYIGRYRRGTYTKEESESIGKVI